MRDNHSRSRSRSGSNTSESRGGGNAEPGTRLFVSGIPTDISRDHLKKMFEGSGTVVDFFLKIQESGNNFAFVEMEDVDQAEKAIRDLNGKSMGDKALWVKYAKPKQPKEGGGGEREGGNKGYGGRPQRNDNRGRDGGNRQFGGGNKEDRFQHKNQGYKKNFNNDRQQRGDSRQKGNWDKSDGPRNKREGGYQGNSYNQGNQSSGKKESKPVEEYDY